MIILVSLSLKGSVGRSKNWTNLNGPLCLMQVYYKSPVLVARVLMFKLHCFSSSSFCMIEWIKLLFYGLQKTIDFTMFIVSYDPIVGKIYVLRNVIFDEA